jgi:hypothetical protein
MAGTTQGRPEPFGFIISPRRHNRAKALGNLPNNTSTEGARKPFLLPFWPANDWPHFTQRVSLRPDGLFGYSGIERG